MMNFTQGGKHDEVDLAVEQATRIGWTFLLVGVLVGSVSCSQHLRGEGLVSSSSKLVGWAGSAAVALLVSYTFGLIHGANLKNDLVPVLGGLLVFFYATIPCDYLKFKDRCITGLLVVKFLIYIVYAVIMFTGTPPSSYIPLILLLIGSCFKAAEHVSVHIFISCANQLIRPEVVKADGHDDDAIEHDNDHDPFVRCKYAVYPGYPKFEAEDASKRITIKDIWRSEEDEKWCLFDDPVQIQNRCLSVALFWKLLLKIMGIPTYERSHQSKAWKLVQNGLLQPASEKRCPFGVVEEELSVFYSFLHHSDGFFLYQFGLLWFMVIKLTTVVPMVWIAIKLSKKHLFKDTISFCSIQDTKKGKEAYIHLIYSWAALGMITSLLIPQCQNLVGYAASTWPQFSLLCRYLKQESWKNPNFCMRQAIRIVYRGSIKSPSKSPTKLLPAKLLKLLIMLPVKLARWLPNWGINKNRRKLAQYSLLKSFSSKQNIILRICSMMVLALSGLRIATPGRKLGKNAFLTEELKKALRQSLLDYGPQFSNGIASLEASELPEGVKSKLTQACTQFKTDAEAVLVWHIATSVCEIRPELSPQTRESDEFKVTTTLSKYCAYLVALAPDLLPGNAGITNYTCSLAIEDACARLKNCKSLGSIYGKLKQIAEEVNFEKIEIVGREEDTILQQAAVLGKVLEEEITEPSKRWEILAKFWAEMILYLAPNENNEWAHIEKLAGDREFITTLWALLFHAGIVNRDSLRNKPPEAMI